MIWGKCQVSGQWSIRQIDGKIGRLIRSDTMDTPCVASRGVRLESEVGVICVLVPNGPKS